MFFCNILSYNTQIYFEIGGLKAYWPHLLSDKWGLSKKNWISWNQSNIYILFSIGCSALGSMEESVHFFFYSERYKKGKLPVKRPKGSSDKSEFCRLLYFFGRRIFYTWRWRSLNKQKSKWIHTEGRYRITWWNKSQEWSVLKPTDLSWRELTQAATDAIRWLFHKSGANAAGRIMRPACLYAGLI